MSHRKTRRVYDAALTFENVYEAWNTVAHTCKNQRGVFDFGLFAHSKVAKILDDLRERKYWPNKYRCFMIFEPKARLVMSQSIRDKTVNHFVAKRYLMPLLERTLIDTNVATRNGMGSSFAGTMVRRYLAQLQTEHPGEPIYALKVDVSKYFYSIDHEILFEMLKKKIRDSDVIEILRRIVSETNKPYINVAIDGFNEYYGVNVPHYEKNKGLSIGAMTSQFLAIFYLSDLDRYIKEQLRCKYFIRYMDDFVFFSHNKDELRVVFRGVTAELEKLKLEVNPKSAIYNVCSETGVPFLGYRYRIDGRGALQVMPLAATVRRIRRRLRMLSEHNFEKYGRAYESYRGYFMNSLPKLEIEEVVGEKGILG